MPLQARERGASSNCCKRLLPVFSFDPLLPLFLDSVLPFRFKGSNQLELLTILGNDLPAQFLTFWRDLPQMLL